MENISTTIALCKAAKKASRELGLINDEKINSALFAMAEALVESTEKILEANALDVEAARGSISEVMIDRLRLTLSLVPLLLFFKLSPPVFL